MLIPVDVVDKVIEILAQDDPNLVSTKVCSLVCHDFFDLCRKHIFASITLNNTYDEFYSPSGWTKATTTMLVNLLSMTPEIANHIRNLFYVVTDDDLDNLSLIQTFKKITRLQSLTLVSYSEYPLEWDYNPLRPALLHLLHVPTLLHFSISTANNFIFQDLIPCLNLKHLEFDSIKFENPFSSILPKNSLRLHQIKAGIRSAEATSELCTLQCPDGKPCINFESLVNVSSEIRGVDDSEASQQLFGCCDQLIDAEITGTSYI